MIVNGWMEFDGTCDEQVPFILFRDKLILSQAIKFRDFTNPYSCRKINTSSKQANEAKKKTKTNRKTKLRGKEQWQ